MLLVLKNILCILLKADCGANRTYIVKYFLKKWQTKKSIYYFAHS